jgi:uncharacterized protein (TIGR02246 family)
MIRTLGVFIVPVVLAAGQAGEESGNAADLAAIERLHREDSAAAKKGDPRELLALWTADGIALPPGEQPVEGTAALRAWLEKSSGQADKYQIAEYDMKFQEIRIYGDEAVEWARTSVTVRPVGSRSGMRAAGNLMRVLQRQADGTWKVTRAIWNMEQPVREPEKE